MSGAPRCAGSRPLARALVRWQHAAGPYWPYVCAVPLLEPPGRPAPLSEPPVDTRLARLASLLALAGRSALFVDLPPERSLPSAPALTARGFLVVPIVQRWAAERTVIPTERLLALLAGLAERLRRPREIRGVALLLDGARLGPPTGRVPRAPRVFDNRYTLRADRFPPASFLRHDGVERIYWLGRAGIAPDLLAYVRSLEAAGYEVEALPAPVARGRA